MPVGRFSKTINSFFAERGSIDSELYSHSTASRSLKNVREITRASCKMHEQGINVTRDKA